VASGGLALLGQVESEVLDAKRDPYPLATAIGCHKFATDVAAFANSPNGGVIVIGAATRPNPAGQDTIVAVDGIHSSRRPNIQQMIDVLKARVTPAIRGLRIWEIDAPKNPILIVNIPRQDVAVQPFLVRGVQFHTKKTTSIGVTITCRQGAGNSHMSAEEIHSLISAGRAALGRFG
jgi:hypothetical protein